MSDFVNSQDVDSTKWYLKGNMSRELAVEVDSLMKDMSKVSYFFQIKKMWNKNRISNFIHKTGILNNSLILELLVNFNENFTSNSLYAEKYFTYGD